MYSKCFHRRAIEQAARFLRSIPTLAEHSKYPPAEPEALGFEPLKAASGAFVAHANFPLGLARTTDCARHSHPSAVIRAIFTVSIHLCQCPTFKNRKPGHTPGNVKLLLPPRQSRGFSFSE